MATGDVTQLFSAYGGSLASYVAERTAAIWGTPGTIVSVVDAQQTLAALAPRRGIDLGAVAGSDS